MKHKNSAKLSGGLLDTLAQNETVYSYKPVIIVRGNGSDLSNSKALNGRAKRKLITQTMSLSLIDVLKNKGYNEHLKSYWNTYYCQSKVYTAEGRLYGKYCKNRCCTLCNAIRKAHLMNKYLPIIKQWDQPYFVTLTVKSYSRVHLRKLIEKVMTAFNLIIAKYRKRNQRGKGIKLIGIKALECNFNPVKKTYNPHLHLIVETKEMAEILQNEWLQLWGKAKVYNYVSDKAQKITPINDKEKTLIEVIKYGTKIFTEPDVNNKIKGSGNRDIYVAALDNIFAAMKGIRIFERFGFNSPKADDSESSNAKVVKIYDEWKFNMKHFDWLNSENEQKLTSYIPLPQLIELIENRIDRSLE